jgi:hypothetical protein
MFQQCKMREMAERKATQREQLKDKQASSKREGPLQQELIKIKFCSTCTGDSLERGSWIMGH